MAVSTTTNFSAAISNAISFLMRPLTNAYAPATLVKLQMVLEANLQALYSLTYENEPSRRSGRRCLTLSPECLPPRAIYSACIAAGVQWFDWISHLGGKEFDLFIEPTHVAVRYAASESRDSHTVSVWDAQLSSSTFASKSNHPQLHSSSSHRKTLAQQLLENDREEEEEIFAMIADELSVPTWMTPIDERFPNPRRSFTPHSRSSSRSSNSSSGFSFSSAESAGTTTTSMSSQSTGARSEAKLSRRERARQARVYVDTSKTDVTPYDGGKTTVLTGGVMLGGGAAAAKTKLPAINSKPAFLTSNSWRSVRA